MAAILTLNGTAKRFGSVHAVADASVAFDTGRIHAVVGENGAGKTTLLKMAAGILVPDRGEVLVDDVRLLPHTTGEAIRRGVVMVQQHFALVGALSALENVMLGDEPTGRFGVLDAREARSRAEARAREMGVALAWDQPVDRLGVGDRQRVAIVRALVRAARVIILDEPTAVLTPGEALRLYETLRRLADGGKAIVVVTHRLDEVRDHAESVSVMRRGALVSTRAVRRGNAGELRDIARAVMGGDPPPPVERHRRTRASATRPTPVLEVRDLQQGEGLRGVTFEVCAGEIVGVAGVEGNGQRELVHAIAGLASPDGGTIRSPPLAAVLEDRHAEGLVLDATVRDNLMLGELGRFTRFGIVDVGALDREARKRQDRAGLDAAAFHEPVRGLSGGNQQKIVVVRALSRSDRVPVLVVSQPTRGMDATAAQATHRELARAADLGKAVLLVSVDLAELRALCDRILVMARGRVVAELPPEAPDLAFGEAMLGS